MKIKWIELPESMVAAWAAMLGNIHIGGITNLKAGYTYCTPVLIAACFLPSVKMSIREFATLEEAKEDFEQAIEEWIKEAGL